MSEVTTGKLNEKPLSQFSDSNTSDYLGMDGQVYKLPTKEQAGIKAKQFMKKFKPEQWIALKICRQIISGKDHMFALLARKYSDDDISTKPQDHIWIGRTEYMNPRLKQDTQEYSETLGQRVPVTEDVQYPDGSTKSIPVIGQIAYLYYHPVSKETLELYQKLLGIFSESGRETELIWQLNNGNMPINCTDPREFFTVEVKIIQEAVREKTRKSVLENPKEAS